MNSLQHPYTPTDEEVAGRYVDARYQYSDTRKAETRAEFDRWLAAHDARVERDSVRKALTLLATEWRQNSPDTQVWQSAKGAEYYRDLHYPEVAP